MLQPVAPVSLADQLVTWAGASTHAWTLVGELDCISSHLAGQQTKLSDNVVKQDQPVWLRTVLVLCPDKS